jgi:hypothetical protein
MPMKKQFNILALLAGSLFFCMVLCSLWFAMGSVLRTLEPAAKDLLINTTAMPADWSIKEARSWREDRHVLQDQGVADWAMITFIVPDGEQALMPRLASQSVKNYTLPVWAWVAFIKRSRSVRVSLPSNGPPDWTYRSEIADQFRLACGNMKAGDTTDSEGEWLHCTALGRYGRYLSEFSTRVSEEHGMTQGELQRVLEAIDARMVEQLHK